MPKKILVVEDNDDSRELLVALLQLDDFTVVTAEDGAGGIKAAEAERPDLIITDINMPNLNGIEMIEMLREREEFAHLPIMALTAYGEGTVARAMKAGANIAMTKPIQFESLADSIKQMLKL